MKWTRTFPVLYLLFFCAVNFMGCGSSTPLVTKIYDAGPFENCGNILIKDFDREGAQMNFDGDKDSLCHVISVCIQKEIQKLNKGVSAVDADTAAADLILEGKFLIVDEGSSAGRVMLGSGGATVSVKGKILSRDGKTVAEFSKSKTSAGGPLGMGGMLSGSGKDIISDIIQDTAEDIAEFVVKNLKK